jgi:hypothetical protein
MPSVALRAALASVATSLARFRHPLASFATLRQAIATLAPKFSLQIPRPKLGLGTFSTRLAQSQHVVGDFCCINALAAPSSHSKPRESLQPRGSCHAQSFRPKK